MLRVGYPTAILRSPLSQSVGAGGAVTFSVEMDGTPPISARWRKPGPTYVTQVVNSARAFLRVENVRPQDAGTYGVIVANKYSTSGSAPATLTVLIDSDGDGLPDTWEAQYELSEAGQDADGDGLTNLQEYQAGTDPNDAQSYLRIESIERGSAGPTVLLSFIARSNRTYTVQASERLQGTPWAGVLDVVAWPADRIVIATNAAVSEQSFFRLVTPRAE